MTPWQKTRSRAAPWFLLPALLLLGIFVVWPMGRALFWSATNADLLAPGRAAWVGAEHYRDLLTDARFRQAFANTALFAVLTIPLQTTLAFLLALWVNRPEPVWRWLRAVFFIPVIVSMPVLAVLWTMLYQPPQGSGMGLVNVAVSFLGGEPRAWLHDPATALPAIVVMSIWQGVGLQMMVFLASLQAVPRELLEAARLDGASAFQRVVHVVIPSVRNTIIFVITVTTIFAFRLFVQPYLMTRGGPENRTLSLVQSIYEMTFLSQELGRASAAAFLFMALIVLLIFLQRHFLKEVRE